MKTKDKYRIVKLCGKKRTAEEQLELERLIKMTRDECGGQPIAGENNCRCSFDFRISYDHIVEDVDSDDCEPDCQEAHEARRRDALVAWLTGLVGDGYGLTRDDGRGFKNEYTMILISPDTDPSEIDGGWYELDAGSWADGYLYSGDAVTKPYNAVRVI